MTLLKMSNTIDTYNEQSMAAGQVSGQNESAKSEKQTNKKFKWKPSLSNELQLPACLNSCW